MILKLDKRVTDFREAVYHAIVRHRSYTETVGQTNDRNHCFDVVNVRSHGCLLRCR
jgi:hypothetical protein